MVKRFPLISLFWGLGDVEQGISLWEAVVYTFVTLIDPRADLFVDDYNLHLARNSLVLGEIGGQEFPPRYNLRFFLVWGV